MNAVTVLCCAHPGLELQQVAPQQLGSSPQAQPELLVPLPLVELVPLVLVELAALTALVLVEAALVLVEAALVAAPVADMVGNERRMVA